MPYFQAASVLGVPAWSLAGFDYATAADAPICWMRWSLHYMAGKAKAQAAQAQSRLGPVGMS